LAGYSCRGKRPWIGFEEETNDPLGCKAPMRTVQRGASNVYYSMTESALTIPPYSAKIRTMVEKKRESFSPFLKSGISEQVIVNTLFGKE